jgi:hypothetical protein
VLSLVVEETPVVFERQRQSGQVHAQWTVAEGSFDAIVPARKAAGEVVATTGVEVLSDLVYHLAAVKPPKVRRSKIREDS